MLNAGLLQRIADSKANQNGNNIRPGAYLLRVLGLLAEKKFKGNMFIAEFDVLESKKTDPSVEPNPVGSRCSYVVNLDDTYGLGLGNMKAFIMGLCGCSEADVTVDVLSKLLGPEQPAKGELVRDDSFQRPKKGKPNEMFTHHRWERVIAEQK